MLSPPRGEASPIHRAATLSGYLRPLVRLGFVGNSDSVRSRQGSAGECRLYQPQPSFLGNVKSLDVCGGAILLRRCSARSSFHALRSYCRLFLALRNEASLGIIIGAPNAMSVQNVMIQLVSQKLRALPANLSPSPADIGAVAAMASTVGPAATVTGLLSLFLLDLDHEIHIPPR